MTPKEYFIKNFKNAIIDNLDQISKSQFEAFKEQFKDMYSEQKFYEALRTDFLYSNDWCFNTVIESLKKESRYHIIDSIYVGKLRNQMPNCYTVNSDEIDGCLICYTTGMSENTNLFAQTLVSIFEGVSLGVSEKIVHLYTNLLMLEIERRIYDWYGGKIASNVAIDMAMRLLKEDSIYNIVSEASQYSTLMDMILILHEYAHYVLRTWTNSKNDKILALVIKTISIYTSLCLDNPEMYEMLPEEIMADLMSLLLLTNGNEFDPMGIMCMFAAFLQLKKMSVEDKYTNEHRLKVIRYFFKDSKVYQKYKGLIEYSIEILQGLFKRVRAESYNKSEELGKGSYILKEIFNASSLPNEKKYEIYCFGLEHLEFLYTLLDKTDTDTSSSDFEEF